MCNESNDGSVWIPRKTCIRLEAATGKSAIAEFLSLGPGEALLCKVGTGWGSSDFPIANFDSNWHFVNIWLKGGYKYRVFSNTAIPFHAITQVQSNEYLNPKTSVPALGDAVLINSVS